jgi:hypothetical protein
VNLRPGGGGDTVPLGVAPTLADAEVLAGT